MGRIALGANRYGKAETHLLRVVRHDDHHEIRELTVTTALEGHFDDVHLSGDNAAVLPTDSQKNAVHAFAADATPGAPEDFALRLARHLVQAGAPAATRARVQVDEHVWHRISTANGEHPHAFARPAGAERRQAVATATDAGEAHLAAGLSDLFVLKSAGSEFRGFLHDRYTTLPETGDRILATAVTARWRFATTIGVDWHASFGTARATLLATFAARHSRSLQQTLYDMGAAILEARPEVAEVRLVLPNRHHLPIDLAPFGLEDRAEVFHVADRPYGLIEGTVRREGAPGGPALDW